MTATVKNIKDYPLIYMGSAKDKYDCGDDTLIFQAKDTFSVFDVGISPFSIPGKASAITASYVKSVEIAKSIGLKTHFIEQVTDTAVRVKKAQIITDRPPVYTDKDFLVNLEFIFRIVAAGSKLRNFREGVEDPQDYGFPAKYMPTEFDYFPWPVRHHTTKFEPVDRTLTNMNEICTIGGIAFKELERIWDVIWRMTGATSVEMDKAGFVALDGKFEIILGPDREIILGDFHGTPDEDRPVDKTAFKEGRISHYSKEYIREIYIRTGYHAAVKEARKAGKTVPSMPILPEKDIEAISKRYCIFAEGYSGQKVCI